MDNFDVFGMQVELFRHPHVLVLQVKNSFFKLPGGRLRPGEQGLWYFLEYKLLVVRHIVSQTYQADHMQIAV